jgi:hypothetical protein
MKSTRPQFQSLRVLGTGMFALALILFPITTSLRAQCDKVAARCEDELLDFLSDGQYYRAVVKDATESTIKITLYEGFHYRFVVCNDRPGAKVRYRVLDGNKNEVFESMGAKDGDSWDFQLEGTDNFVIKASIPNNVGTGCVVFSVGYDDELLPDDDFAEEDDPFFDDELEDEIEAELEDDDTDD